MENDIAEGAVLAHHVERVQNATGQLVVSEEQLQARGRGFSTAAALLHHLVPSQLQVRCNNT